MKFYDIEQVLILRTLNVSWRKIFTLLYDIQLWQLHTNLQHIYMLQIGLHILQEIIQS